MLACLLTALLGPIVTTASPAAAAGEAWSFTPPSALAGQTITASGTGWDPDPYTGPVYLFLPGIDPNPSNAWMSADVSADGTWSIEVTVPSYQAGQYRFFACQICSFIDSPGPPNAETYLNVLAVFTPAVSQALPNTSVPVTGSGWSPNEAVSLYTSIGTLGQPDSLVGTVMPISDGTFDNAAAFTVPGIPAGKYVFVACQGCTYGSEALTVDVPFVVTTVPNDTLQTLAVAPAKQAVGEDVSVSGTGWSLTDGDVSVYADIADLGAGLDPLATTTVLSGGEINTTVTVPDRGVDSLTLYACQVCGDSDLEARATLTIAERSVPVPILEVQPTSGAPDDQLQATGTGWLDGPVTLVIRRSAGVGRVDLATATAVDGVFEQELAVPDMDPGQAEIVACQLCSGADRIEDIVAFTVLSPQIDNPVIALDRRSVEPKARITVSGADWAPDDGEVTVLIGPAGDEEPTDVWFRVQPAEDGAFTEEVEAPDRDNGQYKVVACQRCDESEHPVATAPLAINGGLDLLLVVGGAGGGLALLLTALLGVMLLRRPGRVAASPEPSPPPTPTARPDVRLVMDDDLQVGWQDASDRPAGFKLPAIDIVARLDPAPLADNVEVLR